MRAQYMARLNAATDETAKATIVAEMENALLAAVQFPKRTTLHLPKRTASAVRSNIGRV